MKKGLIVFEDKKIGREKALSFTEEGVAFSEMIMSEIASEEKSIIKYLGKEDCEKLATISDRLFFYFEGKVGGQRYKLWELVGGEFYTEGVLMIDKYPISDYNSIRFRKLISEELLWAIRQENLSD